ncbi:MAG: excinuclease ABC subunit UvrB [Acidobacteriota bacterium]|nr:excinuclease ABC subunit UvrB [Acidobacteriota bacterium]
MSGFVLESAFDPQGDQPTAIAELVENLNRGNAHQVLLGVTGSGKTFTIAKVIEEVQRPTLVIAHNKTLAAQLYQEFKGFFPNNSVEYFVSYYDYYQPEAYIPSTDTYIAKETAINEEIDRLRHSATRALFERRDVLIVASVSCIYGLGSPEAYYGMLVPLSVGDKYPRQEFLRRLVEVHYTRTSGDLERGRFRVRGTDIEVFPAYGQDALRVVLEGDVIVDLVSIDPLFGDVQDSFESFSLYPGSHYVSTNEERQAAIESIKEELDRHLGVLQEDGKLLEAQRVHQRTSFDLEMMQTIGYCHGIENYSRHITGRSAGEPPPTLIEYMPSNYMVVVDESHMTVPQLRGMHAGDRSRKLNLVEHGFRLPSALDNRPLTFGEFEGLVEQAIYVSATPGPYELNCTEGVVTEQVIRPTGLTDPEIEVRKAHGQIDDLLEEVRWRAEKNQRVLVTTLTKKMAEELTAYYRGLGVRVRYMHADVDTLDRVKLLRDFRAGDFDALVGVNLLREGLDLPEVTLVAVLDADKEGFLRSTTSLVQTSGRASRNVEGRVILYADKITRSMREAMEETDRRRRRQELYNEKHGITPATIVKRISDAFGEFFEKDYVDLVDVDPALLMSEDALVRKLEELDKDMHEAADALDFERAATVRDRIQELKRQRVQGVS